MFLFYSSFCCFCCFFVAQINQFLFRKIYDKKHICNASDTEIQIGERSRLLGLSHSVTFYVWPTYLYNQMIVIRCKFRWDIPGFLSKCICKGAYKERQIVERSRPHVPHNITFYIRPTYFYYQTIVICCGFWWVILGLLSKAYLQCTIQMHTELVNGFAT